jgi:hypothetical protein
MPTPIAPIAHALDETLFAGLAVEAFLAGDRSDNLVWYLERLPTNLTLAITHARDTHVWAPCTVCGEGILIERPPRPTKDPWSGKRSSWPGQACRLTSASRGCKGKHYPLELPWGRWHPLSPYHGDDGALPW